MTDHIFCLPTEYLMCRSDQQYVLNLHNWSLYCVLYTSL